MLAGPQAPAAPPQPAQAAAAPSAGGPADWDLRPRIDQLAAKIARLKPMFDQIHPETWTVEGGAAGYAKQAQGCAQGLSYSQNAAARWAAQPDRLSLMLETLVRLDSFHIQASSLSEGVRRYQNPAVADLLDAELIKFDAELGWVRTQALELAQQREKELEVAQKEAQRCRTQIFQSRPSKN